MWIASQYGFFSIVRKEGDVLLNPDEEKLHEVACTILGFKKILGDKLHLLCGNHDLPMG